MIRQLANNSVSITNLSAVGSAGIIILSAAFWNKLQDATKKWQELAYLKQQPSLRDVSSKMVGESAIRITKNDRWPI
jgi:hypothetical protein